MRQIVKSKADALAGILDREDQASKNFLSPQQEQGPLQQINIETDQTEDQKNKKHQQTQKMLTKKSETEVIGEQERQLSEEARKHDFRIWEHIVRMALFIQKVSLPIHHYVMTLSEEQFYGLYGKTFAVFHQNAKQVIEFLLCYKTGVASKFTVLLHVINHRLQPYLSCTKREDPWRHCFYLYPY